MPALDTIVACAIHPAIGIARVGSSQCEHFLGPEVPEQRPTAGARFKDTDGRLKRQAARFRVYGLDASGRVVQEITAEDARIEWRAHLCNRKAAWYEFHNAMDLGRLALTAPLRNADFGDSRDRLVIDPGPRAISGVDAHGGARYRFDTGSFVGKPVYLGELRTDDRGRLLVLGGRGESASFDGSRPTTFANNKGWHDDVSDGPVRATVTIGDRVLEAEPAVVVVAPPNYGPGLYGVVTMYDVVLDLFYRQEMLGPPPDMPSFWGHIFPIFERLVTSGHANRGLFTLFGSGSPSHFLSPELLGRLADPSEAARPVRERLFQWLRDPHSMSERDTAIPPFYGDAFGDVTDVPQTGLAVTPTQHRWLLAWAGGRFTSAPEDRADPRRTIEAVPLEEQPHALDRANLEDCLGGPFHPGIELTWTLRHPRMWKKPFRLNVLPENAPVRMDYGPVLTPGVALGEGGPLDASGPGTLTWFMGVPWQTDEASCLAGYEPGTFLPIPSFWAARVPNHVLPERAYERLQDTTLPLAQRFKHLDNRPEWLRFFEGSYLNRINRMVQLWDRLGIVAERPGPGDFQETGLPGELWVETEVWEGWLRDDPTYAQTLIAEGVLSPETARAYEEEEVERAPGAEVPPALPGQQHARGRLRRDER